jgi:hypothetical protein
MFVVENEELFTFKLILQFLYFVQFLYFLQFLFLIWIMWNALDMSPVMTNPRNIMIHKCSWKADIEYQFEITNLKVTHALTFNFVCIN